MLIFSDVDGTLLHDTGRCRLPRQALRDAATRHAIVLASSRTIPELRAAQELVGWDGPLIAEDGAVVVDASGTITLLGVPVAELQRRIGGTRQHAIVEALLHQHPETRRDRLASILVPAGAATPALRGALGEAGLAVRTGGRWATITAGSDKGRAARVVAGRWGVTDWVAIGNAANDAGLLAGAERAFVIRNADGHAAELAAIPGGVLLESPGPFGWLEMLARLDRRDDRDREERHGATMDDLDPDHPGS